MSNQQQSDQNRQTGRNGGYVSTHGMPSGQAQQTDRDVNQGKREANR